MMPPPTVVAHATVGLFMVQTKAMPPQVFKDFLIGGFFAGLARNISDDYWREMMVRSEPCPHPGCDCHEKSNQVMAALDALREFLKKNAPMPAQAPTEGGFAE